MYNINEIKLQNQQDAWSLLYLCLCKEICRSFGIEGEGILRNSIKNMGVWQGEHLRKAHQSEEIPTNLTGLFQYGCGASSDPRVHGDVRTETAQVRLWDIYVCPMADFWKKNDAAQYGSFYCEEYMHALLSGYTEGKGQMNIGKTLTCRRDMHCQFAAYYRPSNLTEEQESRSFFETSRNGKAEKQAFPSYICEKTILLCTFVCREASAFAGIIKGEAAFARGLRSYADALIPTIAKHADDVLSVCNRDFFLLNFPLQLETDDDALWREAGGQRAAQMVQALVLDRVKKEFQIA